MKAYQVNFSGTNLIFFPAWKKFALKNYWQFVLKIDTKSYF